MVGDDFRRNYSRNERGVKRVFCDSAEPGCVIAKDELSQFNNSNPDRL
jgi:hypothetical protein